MTRQDFSGLWLFDPDASALQIGVPESVECLIRHDNPHFRLGRTFEFVGRSDSFAVELQKSAPKPSFFSRLRRNVSLAPLGRRSTGLPDTHPY